VSADAGAGLDGANWVRACATDEIELEDVVRFDHDGRTFAIYRSPQNTFHASAGLCTHERAHLADGLVMGDTIECPKHNGRFDYRSGEVKRRPACLALRTYPIRVQDDSVFIGLSD
jgi:3-phenylpropionate/trans-cinnamate dioxygenase ferredoxin subunit